MSYHSPRFGRSILAIALVAVAAAPVYARTNNSAKAEQAAETRQAEPAANAARRYCINSDFTATRVQRRVCKTKKEWASEGVDVDQAPR